LRFCANALEDVMRILRRKTAIRHGDKEGGNVRPVVGQTGELGQELLPDGRRPDV